MKKLLLGTAVTTAMAIGGNAQAAITVDSSGIPVINTATTYEVYLSGASAMAGFLEQLLLNSSIPAANRICDSAKLIYKFQDTATLGKDYKAYLCELNTKNSALSSLAASKPNLLLYKRDNGGSAQGVAPVIAETAIDFLKVDTAANCAKVSDGTVGSAFTKINCTFTAGNPAFSNSKIPDFGVSDVDPLQFRGDNTPSGFAEVTEADLDKLNVTPAATQVFGMAVTKKLRNALQQAQFASSTGCSTNATKRETLECMPSLSSAQIASIFTGKITSWKQFKLPTGGNLFDNTSAANKPGSDRLHICRRTSGSGTGAQLTVKFLGYPCNSVASAPVTDTGATPESIDTAQVHAMSSSGTVSECLTELDQGVDTIGTSFSNTYGVRWALGAQGSELNNTNTSDWRFVKIDGIEPTLDKVARGKYKDWVELTFQSNKSHAFDTNEKALINEIIKAAGNPVVLSATNKAANHTWGQSGFMAAPIFYNPASNGAVSLTKPVNPFSHATIESGSTEAQDVNNCRMPAVYDLGTSRGIQVK